MEKESNGFFFLVSNLCSGFCEVLRHCSFVGDSSLLLLFFFSPFLPFLAGFFSRVSFRRDSVVVAPVIFGFRLLV